MKHALYLAWRALRARPLDTAILVGSIALILFVPAGTRVLVATGGAELSARAASTPLVVGARGSALELVLSALYFDAAPPPPTRFREVERVAGSGLALAIPLDVRFRARGRPVVGTSLDYLDFRGLTVAEGRDMAVLGECVVGAAAARDLGLAPGSTLVTSPESAFDLAGVYPLELDVVGVLAPAGTADDDAIFADLKTTWIIDGLGHGHQELDGRGASAALRTYQRITPENIESFHFHGDPADYPLSAVLAVPRDEKSATILLGRYLARDDPAQIARPIEVMTDLLETVSDVETFVLALSALVGIAAAGTAALVFGLSIRLRRREIETMDRIGATRARVAAIFGLEIGIVLALSVALAAVATVAVRWGAPLLLGGLIRG